MTAVDLPALLTNLGAARAALTAGILQLQAEGLSARQIAVSAGVDRQLVTYWIRDQPPSMPTVAYLRGAGASPTSWREIDAQLQAAGLLTVHDRTEAWHLARAGLRVLLVDVSAHMALAESPVIIGVVRAQWGDDGDMDLPFIFEGEQIDRTRRYDREAQNKTGEMGAFVLDVGPIVARVLALAEAPAREQPTADTLAP